MKIVFLITALIFNRPIFAEEFFKVSKEVIEARDSLIKNIERMHSYILTRAFTLSKIENKTLAEKDEFKALSVIIFGDKADRELYLIYRDAQDHHKNNAKGQFISVPNNLD